MPFQGVHAVLPTPFHSDGSLDLDSLKRMTNLYRRAGVNGIATLGVTSEVNRLTETERAQVIESVVEEVSGQVPIIVGGTGEGLRICIERSRIAKSLGASAVLISPPRMAALNSDAVLAHYSELARTVDIEIIVQDYPPACGFTMEPTVLARIAREIPSARTIKLEDPPTPLKTAQILKAAQGLEIRILGGLGGVYLLEELLAGASGAMTGFAYPEMLVEVVRLFSSGAIDQAANAFYRYVPLMRFEFQQGIGTALRKEILRRRGALAEATVRAPGGALDAATCRGLDILLQWMRDQQEVKWISA